MPTFICVHARTLITPIQAWDALSAKDMFHRISAMHFGADILPHLSGQSLASRNPTLITPEQKRVSRLRMIALRFYYS